MAKGLPQVTFAELATLVEEFAAGLGPERRLVALAARNDLPSLVAYLGALDAGCVVLLTAEVTGELLSTYDPDVVIEDGAPRVLRETSAHTLHPELMLLLSTSGSTGSPKLVRLSATNLLANASAIAEYLDLGPDDRAATTLPMFYCYGLSVVHSHLLCGASLLLTQRSVLDAAFWDEFRACRATSFAAVPYTIDLLDRVGFADMALPDLRYITQAGGRLAPERVRAYARLGAHSGWRFFVMYGQTEATARMAYLPPDSAQEHPDCIGVPIPGGAFTLEPIADTGEHERGIDLGGSGIESAPHELVYHGPNVMLGYATCPADLALGRTVTSLRTGDLARRTPEGLYQVIGRRSRFAKIFGLRIDLQRLETGLAAAGFTACCVGDDERLVVAVQRPAADPTDAAARLSGLPAASVRVCPVTELPRLANGKPDYPAVRTLSAPSPRTGDISMLSAPSPRSADIRALYATALGLDPALVRPDRTFVDLGGNSLNYVTTAAGVERALGRLPAAWPTMTIAELERIPHGDSRFGRAVDTSTLLRAAAIVLIVSSHIGLYVLWGAAHVLLGVAGFNFARFAVTGAPRAERLRHALRTVALIAVPTAAWVAVTLPFTDYYSWQNVLLLNKILGPFDSDTAGHLWFIEVLGYFMVAGALLIRIPAVDALERRAPFWFAMGLLGLTLVLRFQPGTLYPDKDVAFSPLAAWFFASGWAAAKATTRWQRLLVSAVLLVCVPGYFGVPERERLVLAGLLVLVWLPAIRVPALVAVVAAVLADSSLFVYLLHWQVYPLFGQHHVAALLASLLAGVAATRVPAVVRRRWESSRHREFSPRRGSTRRRGSLRWPALPSVRSGLDGPDLRRRFARQFR
ncbi:acyl-CoA synthetase (AMP-forming)/AMP-acid ligase II [Nocardia tenerifensis]|uniref:Acyl-CoA synthetase (AMP-forming)/AMP-acid ligase II n=1 Tax=Nocardia tenerifensis TaxID=228006 RepID=A0A318JSN5_9NOCA|nr:AMP-binding protein [Nocardia tenerifensis]PXX59227.1 acyl-CoA synthetase (AMP-forming)/AMP-acid ligase II [Nocardia tenerifensis]